MKIIINKRRNFIAPSITINTLEDSEIHLITDTLLLRSLMHNLGFPSNSGGVVVLVTIQKMCSKIWLPLIAMEI